MKRSEIIKLVGFDKVLELDNVNCDLTNRLTGDDTVEFIASVKLDSGDRLTAYYYQDSEAVQACDDLAALNWQIDHYTLE